MRLDRLQALAQNGVAFDTETHWVRPGLLAPPLVCGSAGWLHDDLVTARGEILTKDQCAELFVQVLADPTKTLVGANVAYDILVMAVYLARKGHDVMPLIFEALDDGRVYDLQIAEALHAIAEGHLGLDPRTGGQIVNPETGKPGRYSLAAVTDLVLGRKDAKANDEFRERYAELDGLPMETWPQPAIDYPIDDARNTIEVALAQVGALPKTTPTHRWGPRGACLDCGVQHFGTQCMVRRPHRNLHDLSAQVYTAFAMHAGAAWGFHVNQKSVDIIERYALRNRDRGIAPYIAAGIIRENGTENRSVLKRMVAEAYGASAREPCPTCAGSGKVLSPKAPLIRCPTCKGKDAACLTCRGEGKIRNPKSLIACFDPGGDDGLTKVKTCDGTGLFLNETVPRSAKDGISYGRDTLHESGNEFLMGYGDVLEDAKDLKDYIPYLRTARVPTAGHAVVHGKKDDCDCLGPYTDIPMTLRPNPILETGRVSYQGYIMLFKRKPGFTDLETDTFIPSLRECFEARPHTVYSSEDFIAGELVTHGTSCQWIVGHSDLGDALLAGIDPHSALAATVLNVTYDEFIARKKERKFKDARQAAKPFTFGKPGGIGDAKLVLQQRKQGPDTPCDGGPHMVDDGTNTDHKIPGFKGLRFCILMDNASACGVEKVTEWRDKPIPPTCVHCLDCAQRLGKMWREQWSENGPYFAFINECMNDGMTITSAALARWPWLQGVFRAGQRLAPGEVMQHVSGRVRGGLDYCAAANGFFQGLLSDLAKSALRRVSRECYDSTFRVPDLAHENSIRSAYTGCPSPLLGSRVLVFQHDEVIAEHPESIAHDAAMRISEVMIDEMRWYCPELAPAAKAEPTLMRRWLKNATPWWRDGGEKRASADDRLVPWEP